MSRSIEEAMASHAKLRAVADSKPKLWMGTIKHTSDIEPGKAYMVKHPSGIHRGPFATEAEAEKVFQRLSSEL